MRYIILASRVLLGLIFFVFGLNQLLNLFQLPAPTSADALTFMTILHGSHWLAFVGAVMVVGGLLLLVNRFVPLALTLLAPVIVNILLYHALLWPHKFAAALVVLVLEVFLLLAYFRNFVSLFAMNPEADLKRL